ncbi:hypothetical protein BKA82DRAFT_539533 [Pisolithus tinctorius]|uniref:Glucose receptor Git3 N-terminal domain-containing protein n=1 Tax=Pisolithus tinctorius Marx 270 TaxID=870435 RepID=A0A0C3PA56_PISTI|nr:hypothetical protein BKA82DRAFT_539533 [Pisolithus tinctorius]KIO04766.1 hypothetical protein M404DRAFT_539533 [Pisolithus tinctorius Marx 270]
MAIALHILRVLVLEWIFPPKFALRILAIIWLVIAILVVVPNVVQNNIYGPTSHWCWIDRGIMQQIGLDYMWMWLTAVLNIISYLLLALVVKRLVVVDGCKLRWGGKQERGMIAHGGGTSPESVRATQMLFYPLLYVVLVLPLSAARFSQIRGDNVPFSVTASSAALFALSGLFNTILYAFTRPRLIPGRASRNPEGAHVTIAGMAHDRFRHGYVAGDDSFVMTTGLDTVP